MNAMLRLFFSVLSVTCLIFVSGCITDEPETDVPLDITLEQLVERMERATDPDRVYQHCTSYILKQKVTSSYNSKEYVVETKFKLPNFMKTTTYENDAYLQSILYNGKHAWEVNEKGNKEITGKPFEFLHEFAEMGHPANTILNVFLKVEFTKIREGKKQYYKLVCFPKNEEMSPCVIYLDAYDYLTRKMETNIYSFRGKFPYKSTIDKYEKCNGVLIPKETVVDAGGSVLKYTVIDYKLNVEIPDSEFNLPVPWFQAPPEYSPVKIDDKKETK